MNRWKPGDEVVAHCLSVELEDPAGPRRHDDGPAAADLGLRDQLRRPGRAGPGQEQPADAQARPPDLGGGRRPRAGQLHRLPAAGQPQRREHEAGRRRADLGRLRRPGLLRHPDGAQRRRHPGLRGRPARRRPRSSRSMGAELVIDRSAEGYRFWKDEHTQDPKEWQRLGQEDPRADRRRRRRHRLRAPRPGDLRRQRLRRQEGRHDRHLRLHQRLHAPVRQPLPVDEPQADHRLATSPTTRRRGRPTGSSTRA